MRILSTIAFSTLALGLIACAADGYYDNDGIYHYYSDKQSRSESVRGPHASTTTGAGTVYTYTQRGYYDEYGNYVTDPADYNIVVSDAYYPRRGMCRVWFTDRAPEFQPPVQPCARVRALGVPAGAYVVYGG